MFMTQLLEMIGIKVLHPIVVQVDIIGAIFMSNNIMTTTHTYHVNVKYKYINVYVKDGVIKIILVKIQENDSDIMTKI